MFSVISLINYIFFLSFWTGRLEKNNVDPDQTASYGNSLIRICTVCHSFCFLCIGADHIF